MKARKIVKKTVNRGEFNRTYKRYLEGKGEIRCTYCRYHRGENGKGRGCYGGYERMNGHFDITFPSWKLVSKNRKQWMKTPIKINEEISRWTGKLYIDITW